MLKMSIIHDGTTKEQKYLAKNNKRWKHCGSNHGPATEDKLEKRPYRFKGLDRPGPGPRLVSEF